MRTFVTNFGVICDYFEELVNKEKYTQEEIKEIHSFCHIKR